MPVSKQIYSFPLLSKTFHGLPGLFADSIPDKFGNRVIDAWLIRQGRLPESFTALERLCYTGNRGMGALEFLPLQGPDSHTDDSLDVENLRIFAAEVLNQRKRFSTKKLSKKNTKSFEDILRVGTSAGGARAKILINEQLFSIDPKNLADSLCVSYSSFRRTFKEYTGFSPAKYILNVKINQAKELLTNSSVEIKEIAYNLGFENTDYFFTVFRRLTGQTPLAYRAETQGKKL